MKKDDLFEIIWELSVNRRGQLAAEIYQGLDAVDDDLNTEVKSNAPTRLSVIASSQYMDLVPIYSLTPMDKDAVGK